MAREFDITAEHEFKRWLESEGFQRDRDWTSFTIEYPGRVSLVIRWVETVSRPTRFKCLEAHITIPNGDYGRESLLPRRVAFRKPCREMDKGFVLAAKEAAEKVYACLADAGKKVAEICEGG